MIKSATPYRWTHLMLAVIGRDREDYNASLNFIDALLSVGAECIMMNSNREKGSFMLSYTWQDVCKRISAAGCYYDVHDEEAKTFTTTCFYVCQYPRGHRLSKRYANTTLLGWRRRSGTTTGVETM